MQIILTSIETLYVSSDEDIKIIELIKQKSLEAGNLINEIRQRLIIYLLKSYKIKLRRFYPILAILVISLSRSSSCIKKNKKELPLFAF